MKDLTINDLARIAKCLDKKYGDKLDITIRINTSIFGNALYCCLKGKDDNNIWLKDYKTTQTFYKAVARLFEPKFIQIKKLCVDSFDIDLYLDKKEIVKIKSILSKDKALLSDDREVEISRLYVKE